MIVSFFKAALRGFKPLKPIYIALPVWGKDYVDVFLNATLPAQLSDGNLPTLARHWTCHYVIYTRPEDAVRIQVSPLFARLERLAKVTFESVASVDPSLPADVRMAQVYEAKSDCYRQCLTLAEGAEAPIFMLNADILMADGFLRHVVRVLASGKRVLEVPGPRALKEPVLSDLASRFTDRNGVIRISSRQLADLWIKHIHPLMLRHVWDEARPPDDFHPSHLYWPVGDTALLAHCFHLYPILIWPRFRGATFRKTIDDVLVESAAPSMSDTDIPDSDIAFCIELSGPDHHVGRMARRDDDNAIVAFYREYGTARNLELLRHPIRISGSRADPRAWSKVETEARRTISRLVARTMGRDRELGASTQDRHLYEAVLANVSPSAGTDHYGNRYEAGVRIAAGTELQGQCVVGCGTELNNATLYPLTRIGRYCSIARGAAIGAPDHPITGLSSSITLPEIHRSIHFVGVELGHDVWVGANATILAGVKVGHGAVIGANAVVTKDVRPYAIVVGTPAKELRRRFPDEICDALLESCWWDFPTELVKTLPATDVPSALRIIHGLSDKSIADPTSMERLERRLAHWELSDL